MMGYPVSIRGFRGIGNEVHTLQITCLAYHKGGIFLSFPSHEANRFLKTVSSEGILSSV